MSNRPLPPPAASMRLDEDAGAVEPFEDAALYDWEYRRRRRDLDFYRRIASECFEDQPPAPILDLACGTGRISLPLLREGYSVVGVDRSGAMLSRAATRIQRLALSRRKRSLLLKGDMRNLPIANVGAGLAICAFHSVQHLIDDQDWNGFLRGIHHGLRRGGWLVFDVLPTDLKWLHRDPAKRWARTRFRHPVTRQRFVYTHSHVFDPIRNVAHMRFFYQPIDDADQPSGPEHVVRLCHRQLTPIEVGRYLSEAGFELLASFADFDGSPQNENDVNATDQHIYVARKA